MRGGGHEAREKEREDKDPPAALFRTRRITVCSDLPFFGGSLSVTVLRHRFVCARRRLPGAESEAPFMKLSVYYESNLRTDRIWLDTGDEDCTVMIERDWEQREAESDGRESVERRSPQDILDETSRAIYNSHHKASRRSLALDALDPEDKHLAGGRSPEDIVCEAGEKEALYDAMRKLTPEQQHLLYQIFWENRSQRGIAAAEQIRESSLADRKRRALERLKKLLRERL